MADDLPKEAIMLNRRSFIAGLSALATYATSSHGLERTPDPEITLAWTSLRFVITAQHIQKSKRGAFVTETRLLHQDVIQTISDMEKAEQHGIGRSFIQKVDLDSPNLIPGWKLQQITAADSFQAVLIRDGNDHKSLALATDQKGLVYSGTVVTGFRLTEGKSTDRLLEASRMLNYSRRNRAPKGRRGSLEGLMAFGFMPMFAPCPKCCDESQVECECPGFQCSTGWHGCCVATDCAIPFCCTLQICS
jgi:hypothetical protein